MMREAMLGTLRTARDCGLLVCWVAAVTLSCQTPTAPRDSVRPVIVIGLDGADPDVLKEQWALGQLPHLRALAERGSFGVLETAYGQSPVIWTTIITGRNPRDHGIEGFLADTPQGQVHASTSLRKTPALWNMLSRSGRRTAVIGWWPSWPAEDIEGIVISDRAHMDVPRRVSPESFLPRFLELTESLEREKTQWNPARGLNRDLVTHAARLLLPQEFDLTLIYFRDIDFASHVHWSTYDPEPFGLPSVADRSQGPVPDAYRIIDAEVGSILEQVDPETNVFVVSDHGFRAAPDKKITVSLKMNGVLAHLGYLHPDERTGECRRSRIRARADVPASPLKLLELCGEAARADADEQVRLRERLRSDLAEITYVDGSQVFDLKDPAPNETARGADLVVVVRTENASRRVLINGRPNDELIRHVGRVTGDHDSETHGIIIAAGPDIVSGSLAGMRIHDVAPTILFALGLPVAKDFAGRARVDLFNEAFTIRRPLQEIPSWGTMETSDYPRTDEDDAILEELKALGYLSSP